MDWTSRLGVLLLVNSCLIPTFTGTKLAVSKPLSKVLLLWEVLNDNDLDVPKRGHRLTNEYISDSSGDASKSCIDERNENPANHSPQKRLHRGPRTFRVKPKDITSWRVRPSSVNDDVLGFSEHSQSTIAQLATDLPFGGTVEKRGWELIDMCGCCYTGRHLACCQSCRRQQGTQHTKPKPLVRKHAKYFIRTTICMCCTKTGMNSCCTLCDRFNDLWCC